MAMIWIRESNSPPKHMIDYALDPSKTEGYTYVSCIGCDPETAVDTFLKTKERYDKEDGRQTFHVIQSFKPGEVSPMVAHEIGNRFIKMLFDDYEVVLATHTDRPHVHNHIVFNSVSDKTGKKHHVDNCKENWKSLCDMSDQLCREYGLDKYKRKYDHPRKRNEWKIHKDGMKTQWDLLYRDVDETTHMALDLDNFFELMEKRGYQVIRRIGRFPLFRPNGSSRRYGIHQDGRTLTEEDLQRKIELGMEENESVDWTMPEEKAVNLTVETEKGLVLLYQSMLNVLMVVGQGEDSPYPLVRYEEIKRFRQYKEQQEYLEKNGIETVEQLQGKIGEIEEEISQLKEERTGLFEKRKQLPGIYKAETEQQKEERFESGEPDRREITENLDRIEEQLKKLKHELYLCRRVENEAPSIKEKLSTKVRDKTMEKERTKQRTRTE